MLLQEMDVTSLLEEQCAWSDDHRDAVNSSLVGELAVYRYSVHSSLVQYYPGQLQHGDTTFAEASRD